MPRQFIPVILIAVGMLLLVVSYLMPESGGGWTEDKSKEHSMNAAKLHQMSFEAVPDPNKKNQPPKVSQAELAAQREKWERGERELAVARTGGAIWGQLVWLLGFLLAAGGIGAAFLIPSEHEEGKKK